MRLLFDLDNTVNRMWTKWSKTCNERFGDKFDPTTLMGQKSWGFHNLSKGGERVYDILGEPGFYRDVEVFPGADEVLPALHAAGHEIIILTASHANTMEDKEAWLLAHFPFLTWDNVVVASKKHLVKGDVLVDDGLHNLVGWHEEWYSRGGIAVAMNSGYNQTWGGRKVNDWYDFLKLFNSDIRFDKGAGPIRLSSVEFAS